MFKVGFEKAEEPEIKLPIFTDMKAREFKKEKKIYISFINYTKTFDCVNHNKCWKTFKEMEISNHLPICWETCIWVKTQHLEHCME